MTDLITYFSHPGLWIPVAVFVWMCIPAILDNYL